MKKQKPENTEDPEESGGTEPDGVCVTERRSGANAPLKRGQKVKKLINTVTGHEISPLMCLCFPQNKLKKMKDKYKDQDEEDREMMMKLLGVSLSFTCV